MAMRPIACSLLLAIATLAHGQALRTKGGPGGLIAVGGRTSMSFFNDGGGGRGTGVGGQLRIRLAPRVTTDWFYDYFTSPIGGLVHRQDQHIGWNVGFDLREPGEARQLVQPYAVAGHCFDYTRQQANRDPGISIERWSSAVQAGLGARFNLGERTDIAFLSQYMIHLGTDVHADEHDGRVEFHKEKGGSLEGHLLLHVSFSYTLFDAW